MADDKDGDDRKRKERVKRQADKELNRELEDTFPASDPPTVTRVPYEREYTSPRKRGGKSD